MLTCKIAQGVWRNQNLWGICNVNTIGYLMDTTLILLLLILVGCINIWLAWKNSGSNADNNQQDKLIKLDSDLSRIDPLIRQEFGRNREEQYRALRDNREEQQKSLESCELKFSENVRALNEMQRQKFEDLFLRQDAIKKETEYKLAEIRSTVELKLQSLQEDNKNQLDEMRKTVDEKLQEGLEKRFNQSFTMISDRLDLVHKGLGEMQTLATGVGDLKKVLSNVKTRGIVGEIQLEKILQEFLTVEQYEKNANINSSTNERVEFAIKLPDKNIDGKSLLLPIDSKFPTDAYAKIVDAYENINSISQSEFESARKNFIDAVKKSATDISKKYIKPPITTDFAILFVPTESLYAEIMQQVGLSEMLQRDLHITVVGPTNLVAFLNSLQMGFRTLAIEKRSGEVWNILGAIKTDFGKFGQVLEATKKKLEEATKNIDEAGHRSRQIEKKLNKVQELPASESQKLLDDVFDPPKLIEDADFETEE